MTRFFVFYTKGTPYQAEAEATARSFAQFGVEVVVVPMVPTGDWMRNCMLRAPMLWELAKQYPHDVISMFDADVRCLMNPVLLKQFGGDVAAHYRGKDAHENKRYCAGILMFGPTSFGRAALQNWAELCKLDQFPRTNVREQVYLTRAIEGVRRAAEGTNSPFNFVNIGDEYNRHGNWIKPGDGTVIVHYEASRFYVKRVGGKLFDASYA